jgi:hypothetical protein
MPREIPGLDRVSPFRAEARPGEERTRPKGRFWPQSIVNRYVSRKTQAHFAVKTGSNHEFEHHSA